MVFIQPNLKSPEAPASRGRGGRLLTAGLLCAALTVGPATAELGKELRRTGVAQSAFMVDTSGEAIRIVAGAYGDFFPDGGDADADAQVLVLEKIIGDEVRRLLVPGTESTWPESSASLIPDERAGVSYLLWESRVNGVHPQLKLVPFDGESWGELREITAGVFASKGEPQLQVTHDTYHGEETVERTVLHVSWWEAVGRAKEKRYAFLAMENGRFIDSFRVVDLTALPGQAIPAPGVERVDSGIRMQSGSHQDMVVMGYYDPSTNELTGLQVEVLPQALSRLADDVERVIADLPHLDRERAAAAIHAAIEARADEFHPVSRQLILQDLLAYLDEVIADRVSDTPAYRKMGARVIWIGAKLGRGGLVVQGEPEVVTVSDSRGVHGSHHLALTRIGSWSVPELPTEPRMFLSRSGEEALLAWPGTEDGTVEYLETEAGGWGEAQVLHLPDGVGLEEAMSWLERKALDR